MVKAKKTGIKVRQVVSTKKTKTTSSTIRKRKEGTKKKRVNATSKKTGVKARNTVNKVTKKTIKKVAKKTINKSQPNAIDTDELVEELMMNNELHRLAEGKRRKIMWLGVSIVMFFVVVAWGYNLQKSFVNNKIKSDGENVLSTKNWGEIGEKIGKQLNEIQNGINKISDFKEGAVSTTTASSTLLGLPETDLKIFIDDQTTSSSEEVVK